MILTTTSSELRTASVKLVTASTILRTASIILATAETFEASETPNGVAFVSGRPKCN